MLYLQMQESVVKEKQYDNNLLRGTEKGGKIELRYINFTPLTNIRTVLCTQKRAILTTLKVCDCYRERSKMRNTVMVRLQ
jgi:hypothetical protein